MDFTFTEEQLAFSAAIRSYLMVESNADFHRKLWETESGRSPEMWSRFAAQGLTGLSVPEEFGGLGYSDVEWTVLAQDLGYFGVADTLTDTAMVSTALLCGLPKDSVLRREWLPRIAEGAARVAIGHPVNPFVCDAHVADLLLLNHENQVHAVRNGDVELIAETSVDMSRRIYRVKWRPSQKSMVCDAQLGEKLWNGVLERGALAATAHMLGLTRRMLDLAIDYSADRKQFGKPIGSFQAVKHLLADVAVKLEFARPVAVRAAYALACEQPRTSVCVSHAKLAAAEASWLAAKNCMQVHGAMGYTWEMDLQMFMKRAWALAGTWGDRAFHKARVAAFIFADSASLGPGATFQEQE